MQKMSFILKMSMQGFWKHIVVAKLCVYLQIMTIVSMLAEQETCITNMLPLVPYRDSESNNRFLEFYWQLVIK